MGITTVVVFYSINLDYKYMRAFDGFPSFFKKKNNNNKNFVNRYRYEYVHCDFEYKVECLVIIVFGFNLKFVLD